MDIEVELRAFLTKEQYDDFLDYFNVHGEFVNEDYQETFYFDCPEDLRIQKNKFYAKVWLKKGKLHDDHREEIEIKFSKEDFDKMEKLFLSVGFNTQIQWFRTRHTFKWQDLHVMIDDTKGYGYIIELEKMSTQENKEQALQALRQKFEELKIPVTPKEEFDKKFQHYKEHWKELTQ